ncbi:MAG: PD40 domain-containing protein [Acidobacteria bacterium]|nr:PD40 domain-containing protein [Acidobacteriota bacterium]
MKALYKIGAFYLDPEKKLLIKENQPVAIQPKVFDTLLALVEGRGTVLTKDDLMEKIWSNIAVEENNLQQHISALRKILGKTEDGKPYIETLPKRGYRFTATVEELEDDGVLVVERRVRSLITIDSSTKTIADEKVVTPALSEPLTTAQNQPALAVVPTIRKAATALVLKRALLASATIAVVLVAVAVWHSGSKMANSPKHNHSFLLKQNPILGIKNDGETSGVINGKLSPDASLIAYSLETKNKYENIWIKSIDNNYALPLTNEWSKNWNPIWSANGSEIAFLSDRGGQLGLWKVHHVGGPATLIKSLTPHGARDAQIKPRLIYWAEDGKTIYYQWDCNVFALDMASKEANQLTGFDPDQSIARDFCLSPDQAWLAYVERKDGQFDIWKIPTKGGAPLQVTHDAAIERSPVWSADGNSLIYEVSQEGVNELRMVEMQNAQAVFSLSSVEAGDIADISRDGTKILYRSRKDESDLWKVNVATGEDVQITSDIGVEFWPDFSPDGQTIVYQAKRGSNFQIDPFNCTILTKSLARDRQPAALAASACEAQWSPDGTHLAFLRQEKSLFNLSIVEAIGGQERRVTEGGVSSGGFALVPYNLSYTKDYSWSPDSSKIAYIAKKEEVQNVWVTAIDGSGETQLSNHTDSSLYLACPLWSPDGKRLAYISDDYKNPQNDSRTFTVWLASLEHPEKPEAIFHTDSYLNLIGWSGDDQLLMALLDKAEKTSTSTYDLDLYTLTGKTSQKITTLKQTYLSNLHLSPDQKSLAFVARLNGKSNNLYTYALKGGEPKAITKNTNPTIYFSSLAWSPDGKFICYGKQERTNSLTLIEGFQ